MKIAIISDVHGNYQALKAVLENISKEDIEKIYCLGDIVGYGPNPSLCVQVFMDRGIPCVMGNHDAGVLSRGHPKSLDTSYFIESALEVIDWTISILEENELQFLSELEYVIEYENLVFTHSSLVDPRRYDYLIPGRKNILIERNIGLLQRRGKDVLFVGHTHIPWTFKEGQAYTLHNKKNADMKLDKFPVIVNVGSVGQPRDGCTESCYVKYDTESGKLSFISVPYDKKLVQKNIWAIDELSENTRYELTIRLEKGK